MLHAQALALPLYFEDATRQVSARLSQAGFAVVRSFDLRSAQLLPVEWVCPHHGTAACDCELAVFLVYAATGDPVTVLAHGHNRRTWFSVVETTPPTPGPPHQPALVRLLVGLVAATTAPELEEET